MFRWASSTFMILLTPVLATMMPHESRTLRHASGTAGRRL
jgi:hypothetical protein